MIINLSIVDSRLIFKQSNMNKFKSLLIIFAFSILFSSCYTYTTVVGEGSKSNQETTQWNHYLLWGLAPVNVSDPAVLAGEKKDYKVKTEQSFVNGLVSVLTFGIYAPTTTTIIE